MTRRPVHRRRLFRAFGSRVAFLPVALASSLAAAQAGNEGMDRSGILDIRGDDERRFFSSLLCTCGCPRESIATCTCGFASGFRSDVRAMIAQGLTIEQVKAEWVRRYGPASLAVPPNGGFDRFLYLGPLAVF